MKGENPQVFRKLKRKLAEFEAQAVPPNIPPNRPPAEFRVPKEWGHPLEAKG